MWPKDISWPVKNGRRGATYILGGERVSLEWMWRVVRQVTGLRASSIKIPMPLAIIGTWFTPLYYRLARTTPRFTRYALETVQSNSNISIARAQRELGYQPRSLATSLGDTVRWWLEVGRVLAPVAIRSDSRPLMKPSLAVISGASSGICAEPPAPWPESGWRVVLAARRAERLGQLAADIQAAGGQAEIFPVDLAQPDGRQALFEAYPQADLLVNNAGLGWYGYVEKMPWNVAQEMIAVNMAACCAALPALPAGHARPAPRAHHQCRLDRRGHAKPGRGPVQCQQGLPGYLYHRRVPRAARQQCGNRRVSCGLGR